MTELAVFGAGRIGQVHALNAAAQPSVRVRYLVDPVAGPQRDGLAARLGAEIAEPDTVFADPRIEAVVIASSTDSHADLLERAADAGKAVFCEKPVSLDFATVERVAARVTASGVACMLGFQRRYDPDFRAVRDRIVSGAAGRLEHVVMHTRDPAPPPRAYVERSGGMFRDQAIHDFDMARYLLGEEIRTVYAVGACLIVPEIGAAGDIDTAMITLTSESGRFVQLVNCRRAPFGYDQRLEALCSKEALYVENRPATTVRIGDAAWLPHRAARELLHRTPRRPLPRRDGGLRRDAGDRRGAARRVPRRPRSAAHRRSGDRRHADRPARHHDARLAPEPDGVSHVRRVPFPDGVRLGVSPLSWTNEVLQDLGGDTPAETCLADAAAAGYTGVELGCKFPRDPALLGPLLGRYDLDLVSGWWSGELAGRGVDAEMAAVAGHAGLLRDLGCTVMVYGEVAMMTPGAPLDAPMSCRRLIFPTETSAPTPRGSPSSGAASAPSTASSPATIIT